MNKRSSAALSRPAKYERVTRLPTLVKTSVHLPLSVMLLAASASSFAQTPEQTMKEVVVSACGFEQDVKEAPASITVITREQLESKRVNSIAEALENVEGIDVTSTIGKT